MGNVFLFTGENTFALREERRRWTAEFAGKHGMENLLTLDGKHITLRGLLDEISVAPFIASRRLVVVSGVPKFSKDEMKVLFQSIHPSCILLFWDPAPDKRLSGLKELMANATVKEFPVLRGAALTDWMIATAKANGAALMHDAAAALLQIAGEEQDMLAQEIAKLSIGRTDITVADVRLLAVPSGEQEIWHITNLLVRGDLPAALGYAHSLLRSGEDAFSLWNMLLWMTRCLGAVVLCVNEGERNPAKVASMTGVPFPTARTMIPAGGAISIEALQSLIEWAVAADRDLKTGGYRATAEANQELTALIDGLIVRCCGLQSRTAIPSRSA